jgi:hypothetical protein
MKNAKKSLEMLPQVQRFAFGGIANPTQRATLRASDREYLEARQREAQAYEKEAAQYNEAVARHNAALEAGTAGEFTAKAPTVPFKEEEFKRFEQDAVTRARKAAGNRATAINVVSNPEQFGFGSMSIADRFMSEGGSVEKRDDSARGQLAEMTQRVASAGRGGDEELAYLSPSARDMLKRMGGAGTVNPATGLPEFFETATLAIGDELSEDAIRAFKQAQAAAAAQVAQQDPAPVVVQRKPVQPSYNKPPSVRPGDAFYESPEYKAYEKEYRVGDPMVPRDMAIHESPYFGFFGSSGLGKGKDLAYESYLERVAREAREAAPAPRPIPVTPPSMPVTPVTPPSMPVIGQPIARAPVLGFNVDISRFILNNMGGAPVSGVGAPAPRPPAGSAPMFGGQPAEGAPRPPAGSAPMMPDYSLRGVGTAQQNLAMPMFGGQPMGGASTNPQNYFAMMGPAPAGQLPGTVASAPLDMPLAAGQRTLDTINANPNLTPRMLGGIENAGIRYDRMGNAVYAPGMGPMMFAKGGEVSADDDEDEKGVGEVGSAQELLAQLEGRGPRSEKKAAPALKRMSTRSDGASMPKGMGMEQESLGSVRELVAMAKDKGSARQQMEELARLYQLKLGAAQNRSRGLAASTFEAPTLEGTTLTKNTLATKRFAEGGEANKSKALPTVMEVRDYATEASGRLFPDQGGQDDQRDAARHMLAGAALAKRYGPNVAKLLGLAHEYSSNPQTFFSGLGIGQPRDDFEYDEHNNRVGMGLASRATSREELEALVREMAAKASTEKREGRPWIMGQEKMDARSAKAAKGPAPRPEYRSKGSPEEGEFADPEAALFGGRDDVPAPAPARNKVLDEILGAGETALTLGTGAAAGLAGMPYGLYKGLTSGKYLEGKAADIAGKEAAAFMERNTYQPRLESGRENLAAIGKAVEPLKLAPTPGGAAMASLARPTAVRAQVERLGMAAEKKLEGPVTRTLEKGGKAADLLKSFETQPSRVATPTPAPTPQPSQVAPPASRVKAPAPASELGFYSAAEQAALNLPRKEGTGAAFLNDLMKAPDVKKEELSAMGLDEFLKGKPKATRQEVQDFIANNRFDVKEVQLGAPTEPAEVAAKRARFQALADKSEDSALTPQEMAESLKLEEELGKIKNPWLSSRETKFDSQQLPGGQNYREILLTLPSKEPSPTQEITNLFNERGELVAQRVGPPSERMQQTLAANPGYRLEAGTIDKSRPDDFTSSHWEQKNVLAHLRVNDRVDADGKKMLLIEELQSDWHQAGRDKGYGKVQRNEYEVVQENGQLMRSFRDKNEAEAFAKERGLTVNEIPFSVDTGVPDAPFKDTWHQLALKRALKYAADNGYERVGLTTGKQQAQRYDLSKQVDYIDYRTSGSGPKTQYELAVVGKNGDGVDLPKKFFTAEELPNVVGKEVADKIISGQGQAGGGRMTLRGLDLQVGGEGMKKYYDEIYPGFLAKQAKKYGAQVGETSIKTQTSAPAYVDYFVGQGRFNTTAVLGLRADGSTAIINQTPNSLQAAQQLANRYKEKHLGGGKEPVRYIDITPEMKGAVPYAKGGPVDKNTAFIKAHS